MFNNIFEPIIIHFVESNDNINNNNEFFVDYRDLAKIIINIATFGKDVKILNENNEIILDFWNSIDNQLSEEFRNSINDIIIALMGNNHLNLDVFLQLPIFQGIVNNNQIQTDFRTHFNILYDKLIEYNNVDVEAIDFSDYNDNPDDLQLKSDDEEDQYNGEVGVKGISPKKNSIFSIIRKTEFKPNKLFEYLKINVENYIDNSKFFNKFMHKLHDNIDKIDNLPGFFVEKDKLTEKNNSFSTFSLIIKDLKYKKNDNEDDDEEDEENDETPLMIKLELIEYDGKNKETDKHNSNKKTFYLTFNYIVGDEIYHYYQYIKLFKEKAKKLLKEYFNKK